MTSVTKEEWHGGKRMVVFLHPFVEKRIHESHYVSNEKSVGIKKNLMHSLDYLHVKQKYTY